MILLFAAALAALRASQSSGAQLESGARTLTPENAGDTLVMLYSGRWNPESAQVQRAVHSHVDHIISPLGSDRRVLVCFAATPSQWCGANASLRDSPTIRCDGD